MSTRKASLIWLAPSALAVMFLFCGPLLAIFAASLTPRLAVGGIDWSGPTLSAYQLLFVEEDLFGELVPNYAFLSALGRSLYLAIVTTLICLVVAIPVTIVMSQQPRWLRTLLLLLVTIPFWANLLIRNYAWILILRKDGLLDDTAQLVVPGFNFGLLYTQGGILIGLIYSFLPFMILPMYARAERFDWRLADAALDLGATRLRMYRTVILPYLIPGISAGSLLVFIPSLGSYITPQLLGGGREFLLGNLIAQQFGNARNWAFGASIAIALLLTILTILLAAWLFLRSPEQREAHS